MVSRSGDATGEVITTRSIRARTAAASATATAVASPTHNKNTDASPATATTPLSSSSVLAWQLPLAEQEMVLTLTNQVATATRYFARLSSSIAPVVRMSREEEVVYGDEEAAKMQTEVLAELTRK